MRASPAGPIVNHCILTLHVAPSQRRGPQATSLARPRETNHGPASAVRSRAEPGAGKLSGPRGIPGWSGEPNMADAAAAESERGVYTLPRGGVVVPTSAGPVQFGIPPE